MTWVWLRTLHEVLLEVHTIKIRFHHCNDKIIFASYLIQPKVSQKLYNEKRSNFEKKKGLNFKLKTEKLKRPFYLGDLVSQTGEREISAVSGRLLDSQGELAYMYMLGTMLWISPGSHELNPQLLL